MRFLPHHRLPLQLNNIARYASMRVAPGSEHYNWAIATFLGGLCEQTNLWAGSFMPSLMGIACITELRGSQ